MTYSSSNTITAADYNSFVSTVNGVIGTGSGSKGYGQTALTTVSATDQITAAQWTALLTAVNNAFHPYIRRYSVVLTQDIPTVILSCF